MSSILKALKKLEDESPSSAPTSVSGHYSSRQAFKKNRKAAENRDFRTLALISAVGALAVVAGLIMALPHESSDRPDSESAAIEKRLEAESSTPLDNTLAVLPSSEKNGTPGRAVPETGAGGAVRPKINLKPPPKPRRLDTRAPIDAVDVTGGKADREITHANHTPAEAPVPAGEQVSAAGGSMTVDSDELPNTAEAERPDPGLSDPAISSDRHDSKKAGYQKSLNMPVASDSYGLKLQAIAWADTPEQRMAVINGSVVREGGSIDGVQISRIESDCVVVHGNEGTCRLIYGLQ